MRAEGHEDPWSNDLTAEEIVRSRRALLQKVIERVWDC